MILRALFAVAALAAVVGALLTVTAKNPVRGAMALLLAILGVAGLLVGLHAQFLAAIELIVYAGAVVVLFVFVVMLLGPQPAPVRDTRAIVSRAVAGLAMGGGAVSIAIVLARAGYAPLGAPAAHQELGTIDLFGRELFTRGLVPFEIMAALFVVAVVGAVALVRGNRKPRSTKETAS